MPIKGYYVKPINSACLRFGVEKANEAKQQYVKRKNNSRSETEALAKDLASYMVSNAKGRKSLTMSGLDLEYKKVIVDCDGKGCKEKNLSSYTGLIQDGKMKNYCRYCKPKYIR